MIRNRHSKIVLEGSFAAEVDVDLLIGDDAWSPYLSVNDAMRLDAMRELLRRGDLEAAVKQGRVFRLVPVAA